MLVVTDVISTLNEEDYIRFLIDVIFKQDYSPIEVVVVDGRSTDKTVENIKIISRGVL